MQVAKEHWVLLILFVIHDSWLMTAPTQWPAVNCDLQKVVEKRIADADENKLLALVNWSISWLGLAERAKDVEVSLLFRPREILIHDWCSVVVSNTQRPTVNCELRRPKVKTKIVVEKRIADAAEKINNWSRGIRLSWLAERAEGVEVALLFAKGCIHFNFLNYSELLPVQVQVLVPALIELRSLALPVRHQFSAYDKKLLRIAHHAPCTMSNEMTAEESDTTRYQ